MCGDIVIYASIARRPHSHFTRGRINLNSTRSVDLIAVSFCRDDYPQVADSITFDAFWNTYIPHLVEGMRTIVYSVNCKCICNNIAMFIILTNGMRLIIHNKIRNLKTYIEPRITFLIRFTDITPSPTNFVIESSIFGFTRNKRHIMSFGKGEYRNRFICVSVVGISDNMAFIVSFVGYWIFSIIIFSKSHRRFICYLFNGIKLE